jgi:hypothetical protein
MLSGVMKNVVILSVVAPKGGPLKNLKDHFFQRKNPLKKFALFVGGSDVSRTKLSSSPNEIS